MMKKTLFSTGKVLDGAFTIASKLYGLTFTEVFDIDKYHEEVTTYEVTDEKSELVAIFYADFSSKRKTRWMTSYKSQL
jgi:peptidyl-dipeptidase Dcp